MFTHQENDNFNDFRSHDSASLNINNNEQYESSPRDQILKKCAFIGVLICLVIFMIGLGFFMLDDMTQQFSIPLKFFDVGKYATGVIAIGQFAKGIFCLGQFSFGFVCISQIGFGLIMGIHQVGGSLGFGTYQIGIAFYIRCCQFGIGIWKVKFAMAALSLLCPLFNKKEKYFVSCCRKQTQQERLQAEKNGDQSNKIYIDERYKHLMT